MIKTVNELICKHTDRDPETADIQTNEPGPSQTVNDVEDKGCKSRGRKRETARKERPQRVRSRPAK